VLVIVQLLNEQCLKSRLIIAHCAIKI